MLAFNMAFNGINDGDGGDYDRDGPSNDCDMVCTEEEDHVHSLICGGSFANSVYRTAELL